LDNNPYFSIVVPTYNRGYIISNMIDSLLKQNFKDWELIIVDDGSTDNTKEVIEKYTKNDSRIRYFRLNRNYGTNIAKNYGVKKAEGKWIIFQDSDDKFTEKGLDIIFHLTRNIKTDILFTACITENKKILSNNPDFEGYLSYKDFLCGKVRGEYQPTVRRKKFLKYSFPEDLNGGEGILWLKLVRDQGEAYFSKSITRIYNDYLDDRLSNRRKNYQRLYKVFRKMVKEFSEDYFKYCRKLFFINFLKMFIYYFLWKLDNGK